MPAWRAPWRPWSITNRLNLGELRHLAQRGEVVARPRPSMPGNRTATFPIGTSPPRFCSMLLSFILADARFFRIVEPTLDESVDLRGHFGFT